jgi:NADH-ubiquinone oxidoreductase chain 1
LGSLRFRAQSISFEIVFFFFIFIFLILYQIFIFFCYFNIFILFIYSFLFFILILVELNRAPFDFAEGESELISGFNIEFSGLLFVFIFLSEYGFLVFFRVLYSFLFFYGNIFICFFIFFILIYIRRVFPRYRYDLLINFF